MANMGDREVFDRVLIDPDANALDAALREARVIANEGNDTKSKHLSWPPADLLHVIRRIGTTPDGLHGWHGGKKAKYYAGKSQVTVAWWTNLLGERHVRVLGGHGLTTGARLHIGETGLFRSGVPLSYAEMLYPERTARVDRGGAEALVGVCDCGAVGSFAALGWTGPCCGPCRDHRMEGNAAPPVPWHAGGVKYGPNGVRRLTALAFDPAGGSLLFIHDGLWRWAFATGAVEPVSYPPGIASAWKLAFLPDGKRAVLFGFPGDGDERAVAVWEPGAAAGSEWRLPPDYRIALCLAPDGETVAVSHRERANAKPKLRIRSVHDGRVRHELGTPAANGLLFSPDGRFLLVTAHDEGPQLLDARTGKLLHEFPSVRQHEHAFHPNGRDVYAISDAVADGGVTYEGGGMRLRVVRYSRNTPMHYAAHFMTVSPDGGVLVAGIFGALHFWELTDGAVEAECVFAPAGEALEQFAWAPDGRHLATADRGGTVRLWPWPAVFETARTAEA